MQHLLKDAFSELERWAAEPRPLSLFLDFDGTLTPIVQEPKQAELGESVRIALTEIHQARRIAVGVISGRTLQEVRRRIGIDGILYAGNHGMEIGGPGVEFVDPTALSCREALGRISSQLAQPLGRISGVRIEDKKLSLTIHWRTPEIDGDEPAIRQAIAKVLASFDDRFGVRRARKSLEILPRTIWNKGSAARWMNRRLGVDACGSMYVGDDQSDEDAFEALPEAITVRVGLASSTQARYTLNDPADVLVLLERLVMLSRKR